MPIKVTYLTDKQVKQAKPKDKQHKLYDVEGLQLRINTNSTKTWLFEFRHPFTKKRQTMNFGPYPEISLAKVRKHRAEARELLS